MKNYDVIIIGAGAAGLVAAKQLTKVGMRVILVEDAPTSGYKIAKKVLISTILGKR